MHAQQIFVAALVAFGATLTQASPIEVRGLGDIKLGSLGSISCNLARAKIVGALSAAKSAANSITDATVKQATLDGINAANGGISNIGKALVAGTASPTSEREKVEAGIKAAAAAAQGGDQTDPNVAEATKSLANAAKAGQDVLAQCK
ncbi:hypothetical protein GGTG_12832 [Gaeumannomyces tritici R3-111a-1]|uniref:Cell wall protein n=1 Tax=Gaeumannomyces tritici (strain R3-111a-1) TaxID=644352 RepID=J3PH52_GAET3|nr:hypothetical protein GGTG_12832 [Gaeumannomyces tritici R3-111a-1]EJT69949.1 hypothetical protein GGTG_12832 [Gaeumannomyces tritici R3-111a-1]